MYQKVCTDIVLIKSKLMIKNQYPSGAPQEPGGIFHTVETVMKFEIEERLIPKLMEWKKIQDEKVAILQSQSKKFPFGEDFPKGLLPYYGLDGAGYEFSFIPGGIGTYITVKNLITKEELDLSECEEW